MCGIGGVYLRVGDKTVVASFLADVNEHQRHRGPDSEGTYISGDGRVGLAHRRLSIIDLSKNADQPMTYRDYTISYNGEVYNYLELRSQLEGRGHAFSTTSDTEVLLHLYEEYRERMLDLLLGMFAFVIYDRKACTFFIARDIIGEKPVVYHQCEGGFYVASEPGALVKSLGKKFDVDCAALGYLFLRNMDNIPDPYTPFQGVRKLKPGHYLTVKDGKVVSCRRYWKPTFRKKRRKDAYAEFANVLEESVHLTERSDVPISVLLSGGVDSSAVTCILSENHKNLRTFTFGSSEEDDEIKRARTISKLFNTDATEHILDFRELRILEKVITSWGEPLTNPSFIYSYLLYEKIAESKIKVCITGNGMDELLFGYDRGQTKRALLSAAMTWLARVSSKADIRLIKAGLYRRDARKLAAIFTTPPENDYGREIDELSGLYDDESLLELGYFIGLMMENQHAVTMVGDITGMLHSIEGRNPFLNKRLVEFVFTLPIRYKVKLLDRSKDKLILKKVMEGRLPDEILYAKKMGFGYNVNLKEKMRENTPYLRSLIEESGVSKLLRQEFIDDAFASCGKDLMRVYALASWMKEYRKYLTTG